MKTTQYHLLFLLPRASLKALIIFWEVWFSISKSSNGRNWYFQIDPDFKHVSLSLHHSLLPLVMHQGTVTSIDPLYVEFRMPIRLGFPRAMTLESLTQPGKHEEPWTLVSLNGNTWGPWRRWLGGKDGLAPGCCDHCYHQSVTGSQMEVSEPWSHLTPNRVQEERALCS